MGAFIRMVCVILAVGAGVQSRATEPTIVSSYFHTGYIPNGFDDNDHIQIVGEGLYANTCYRPAETTWKLDKNNNILVSPKSYFYNGICLQVMVPHDEVLNLGILKVGTYKILLEESGKNLGSLYVKKATTENADDYLYAPISQAYYRWNGQKNLIFLSGEFANSCLRITEVKVDVQARVVVIQPISEMMPLVSCQEGKFPFQQAVEIKTVKTGRYLLHVRSLNGKAVNNLIDIH